MSSDQIASRGTSLKARMRQRQEELAKRTTELFPVPRWETIFAVELRAISWGTTEDIIERNQRARNRVILNTAGDEIVAATVGFVEIQEDGEHVDTVMESDGDTPVTSWLAIASGVLDLSAGVSDRVALVALCGEQGVIGLNDQYRKWLGGVNTGISDQVKRDFQPIP